MDSVTVEDLKRLAAEQAANHVESGMRLGFGTGSTVAHFLQLLADRLKAGHVQDVAGVPTSRWTESEAGHLGIPLVSLADHPRLDLAVDGADEVDPNSDLIKGMGGALLREKMVAQAADHLLIIADDSKSVDRLGARSPLPVEVVAWEHESHIDFLTAKGAEVTVRRSEDGATFTTDNGNVVLDCRFADGIPDPGGLDRALQARAGVVETGLFLGLADEVVLASRQGVRVMRRGP